VSNDTVFLKLWIGKIVERRMSWFIEVHMPTIVRTVYDTLRITVYAMRFSHRCCRRLQFSRTWHCVVGWVVCDVLNYHSELIFSPKLSRYGLGLKINSLRSFETSGTTLSTTRHIQKELNIQTPVEFATVRDKNLGFSYWQFNCSTAQYVITVSRFRHMLFNVRKISFLGCLCIICLGYCVTTLCCGEENFRKTIPKDMLSLLQLRAMADCETYLLKFASS
jgi:hypothetical protein